MKRLLITLSLLTLFGNVYSQDNNTPPPTYHNEFGIDATGFIKQFLNFNTGEFSTNYVPTYYLTYRYHLKNSNIRFAIGADFQNNENADYYITDSIRPIYHSIQNSLDIRIGYERYNNLSKRWQVFYGVDFRPSLDYTKDDSRYSQGGYVTGSEETKNIYGIAVFVGFRFKISQRLSLITEANYSANYEIDKSKTYYTPESAQFPPMPSEIVPKTKNIYSSFSQPLSLIIAFDI